MPVTARLVQRLREALGDEATDDLFAWFEEAGWVNRATVREIADLYFERFESRLKQEVHGLRAEFQAALASQRADLVKWMFMFWLGTILPLAGLMVALLRL